MGFGREVTLVRAIVLSILAILRAPCATLASDEALRTRALSTIFRSAQIVPTDRLAEPPHKFTDRLGVLNAPDALSEEKIYLVIAAQTPPESCIASNIPEPEKNSERRLVRMRLYRTAPDSLIAIVQYTFDGVQAAYACTSLGKVVLLIDVPEFRVVRELSFEEARHYAIQGILFHDLGRGVEDLVVESDSGGAGAFETDLYVINTSDLRVLFTTTSRLFYALEEENMQTKHLDVSATRARRSARYCFVISTYERKDKWLNPPQVTHRCYHPNK